MVMLTPPIAFVIYLAAVAALVGFGRLLAGPPHPNAVKRSLYSSGEAPPDGAALPGYRPFFRTALFFAVLHLGVLVLATGGLTATAGLYLIGLFVALLVLLLG